MKKESLKLLGKIEKDGWLLMMLLLLSCFKAIVPIARKDHPLRIGGTPNRTHGLAV